MPAVRFDRILIVGAGQMGAGIAQVAAAAGRHVLLHDPFPGAVERGLATVEKSLARLVAKGAELDVEAIRGRIEPVDGLAAADLMIEAIVEDPAVKAELFRRADAELPPAAVLASNTSSISITRLAAATRRPEQVVGMHFFNPVPVMRAVEVIRGLDTRDDVVDAIAQLARDLGKTPGVIRDVPGFAANRVLMPLICEAIRALEQGVGSAEDIDAMARLGLNHPMGPLALADLIGLDTCLSICGVLEEGLGEPRFAAPPLLRQHVDAGRLGRKSGRGFYDYREG